MRTFLFKILTSKEFENYCHEERGWITIRTVKSPGKEVLVIDRGELPFIRVYDVRSMNNLGYSYQMVEFRGNFFISSYRKVFYRRKVQMFPFRAIETTVQTRGWKLLYRFESYHDIAKKIQKAWRRRRAALTLQRWWKSVYYKPGKGPGYCLAYSSFITEREMSTCQRNFSQI